MTTAAQVSSPAPAVPRPADVAGTMQGFTQKAYGGLEVFAHGTLPRPRIAANEVLVQVHAAGLDRGTWHMMSGRPYLMRVMGFGFSAPKQPVPGLDVAGTVVEVGPAVTRFKVGDEVFGIAKGSYAQFAAAIETKLALKPASLGFEQAAVLGISGITALNAVEKGQVAAGSRVLVIGASGGVGSYAVQLAKAAGAHVTGVSSAAKLDLVRELGADVALDYASDDFLAGQFEVILDLGGNTALSRLRRALAPQGRLVFVGGEHGGDFTAGFERQLAAAFVGMFVKQKFVMLMAQEHFAPLERLAELVSAGKVRPTVDRTFPLERMPEAMGELIAGTVRGKIALRVG